MRSSNIVVCSANKKQRTQKYDGIKWHNNCHCVRLSSIKSIKSIWLFSKRISANRNSYRAKSFRGGSIYVRPSHAHESQCRWTKNAYVSNNICSGQSFDMHPWPRHQFTLNVEFALIPYVKHTAHTAQTINCFRSRYYRYKISFICNWQRPSILESGQMDFKYIRCANRSNRMDNTNGAMLSIHFPFATIFYFLHFGFSSSKRNKIASFLRPFSVRLRCVCQPLVRRVQLFRLIRICPQKL